MAQFHVLDVILLKIQAGNPISKGKCDGRTEKQTDRHILLKSCWNAFRNGVKLMREIRLAFFFPKKTQNSHFLNSNNNLYTLTTKILSFQKQKNKKQQQNIVKLSFLERSVASF